ncbi:MAG: hypothetical protein KDK39_03220 [Leptospiraceae bacterium]|nr:hypothetical protein [Leptospiraceae bacterium]
MAVDPGMVDTVLGTFRGMAGQLKDAGNESDAAKECLAILAKMEALALEMDDLGAWTTKLSTDDYFVDFSTNYGQALAQNTTVDGDSSDEQLMQNTLQAYSDSLTELKKFPGNAHIWPAVEKVIELGKSGLSYPLFLKECEERGLFLGLNSPHAGPTIQYDLYCAEISFRPLDREMYTKQLAAYNALVAKSAFGYPDPVEWEITRQKIEWEYAPRQAQWKAIEDRWDRMLDMVQDWIDSFCSFAPHDARWAGMGGVNSAAQTRKNIERTQECEPGKLKVREDIFQRYFGLGWDDIFSHETFRNQLESGLLFQSDEALQLIRDVYPQMLPGQNPSSDLIARAEAQHSSQGYLRANRVSAADMQPMPFPEFLQERGLIQA